MLGGHRVRPPGVVVLTGEQIAGDVESADPVAFVAAVDADGREGAGRSLAAVGDVVADDLNVWRVGIQPRRHGVDDRLPARALADVADDGEVLVAAQFDVVRWASVEVVGDDAQRAAFHRQVGARGSDVVVDDPGVVEVVGGVDAAAGALFDEVVVDPVQQPVDGRVEL